MATIVAVLSGQEPASTCEYISLATDGNCDEFPFGTYIGLQADALAGPSRPSIHPKSKAPIPHAHNQEHPRPKAPSHRSAPSLTPFIGTPHTQPKRSWNPGPSSATASLGEVDSRKVGEGRVSLIGGSDIEGRRGGKSRAKGIDVRDIERGLSECELCFCLVCIGPCSTACPEHLIQTVLICTLHYSVRLPRAQRTCRGTVACQVSRQGRRAKSEQSSDNIGSSERGDQYNGSLTELHRDQGERQRKSDGAPLG